MPLASIATYGDPEQMEAAYVAGKVELTPTSPGRFRAHVVRVELDRLWLQRVDEATSRIKWTTHSPKRIFFRFLTQPAPEPVIAGMALSANEIIYLGQGHGYYELTSGPLHWAALSMPVEDAANAGIMIVGRDVSAQREPVRVAPAQDKMARIRNLHADIGVLAEKVPHIMRNREVVRALEQSLISAMVDCLSDGEPLTPTWARRCHTTVMRRFRRVVEENAERALYLPEVCAAIGVPERTLRLCCQEHLGMSPKHYLMLRRMQLARRALCSAVRGTATVTDIATRYGFWHFGRFAMTYSNIFGESPSATLASGPLR